MWVHGHWHSQGHGVPGGTDKITEGLAQQGSHPPTSCPAPTGTCLLWKLYSHGLPPPHIRWSDLKETHKNNYCGLGSPRHCLLPENAPVLGWMDVARQGWPLASETERNSGLVSFISVKAAMGSGGSIEMLSANAGALGGHEVARDGPAGLGSARMAAGLEMGCSSVFAVVTFGGSNCFSKIPTGVEYIWGILLGSSAPLLNTLHK